MRRRKGLVLAEHDQAAKKLDSLRNTALGLLKELDGKVSDRDLGQVKVLLNVISQIQLQLESMFDRQYDPGTNPYLGEVVWFADGS